MRQKCSYDHSHKRAGSVFGLSRQRRQHGESRDPVDRTRVLGRSERMSDRSENISVRWDVPSDWTDHAFEALKMFSVRSVDTSEQVNGDVQAVRRRIQTVWKRCRTGQSVRSWRWSGPCCEWIDDVGTRRGRTVAHYRFLRHSAACNSTKSESRPCLNT